MMTIVNVRVDGRLIHGQVARIWTGAINATRIMVLGDKVASDDLEKTALKLARPSQVALSILPPDRAGANFLAGRYNSQNVFIVTREPEALLNLVEAGVPIKEVNVGNLSTGEDRTSIFKSVAVSNDEAQIFKKLAAHGVRIYHQMVPNDPQEDFMAALKKEESSL